MKFIEAAACVPIPKKMRKRCHRAPNRVPKFLWLRGKVAFSPFSSLFLAFARLRCGESYPLGGVYYIHLTMQAYQIINCFYLFAFNNAGV